MSADPDTDQQTRANMAAWSECVAGALTEAEFRPALENAGFGEDRVDGRVRAVAELTPVVVVSQLGGSDWLRGAQSPATAGEGRQNLICSYLAVAVLVGLLANTLLGIWWLDPVVALGIAALAGVEGRRAWRGESCGCATCATGTRE